MVWIACMATAVTANAQIAGWQWAVGAIGGGNDRISDIATDAQGNVYVTGSFTGQISLGGTLLSSAGKADILVAKYNPAGVLLWARKAGGSEVDEGNGIALDAAAINVQHVRLDENNRFLSSIGTS